MSNTEEIKIEDYFFIVETTAKKFCKRYKGFQQGLAKLFEYDDLYQCGMIGLLQAIQNYKPSDTNTFATYAYYRVRGSMMDHLRSLDNLSRPQRAIINRLLKELTDKHSLSAEDAKVLVKNNGYEVQAADTCEEPSVIHECSGLPKEIWAFELRDSIEKTMTKLKFSTSETLIINKYFFEHQSLDSIAKDLELHPSRISQIYSAALTKLRNNAHLFGGTLHVRTKKPLVRRGSSAAAIKSETPASDCQ